MLVCVWLSAVVCNALCGDRRLLFGGCCLLIVIWLLAFGVCSLLFVVCCSSLIAGC